MKSAYDWLKVFGMTNQLITADLTAIEKEYSIELGHDVRVYADRDSTYYPQFSAEVRSRASQMALHYELFYCLENAIRNLISEVMSDSHGTDWWTDSIVPSRIYHDVANRIQREREQGVTPRSEDPIDYTTFGELSELMKANWEPFDPIFNNQRAVERVLANLNTLRAPIAHCGMLAEDEILRLQLSLRDWFRQME